MSNSIFKNQGFLILKLDTGIDLSLSVNRKILFKRPDGVSGFFTATIEGTKIVYQFNNTDLNVAPGIWQFQAYCEINGKTAYGDIFKKNIDLTLE